MERSRAGCGERIKRRSRITRNEIYGSIDCLLPGEGVYFIADASVRVETDSEEERTFCCLFVSQIYHGGWDNFFRPKVIMPQALFVGILKIIRRWLSIA